MDNNQKICYGCMEYLDADGTCHHCNFGQGNYEILPHHLMPGTLLQNRYMVGCVLGEGGFGITYVGRDILLDMKVAVKEFYMSGYVNRNNTYSPSVMISKGTYGETFEKNRERFLNEARVLAKFSDEDGIVGIRDFFLENNTAYIIMDFLNGETLQDYLHRSGILTYEDTFQIMMPVIRSLGNVHKHEVIHRDISPANIMLTKDGKVKLLDFGAAREISQKDVKSLSVILKPGYAPEEQYRSKGVQGPWTDIYAICATLYRCITGRVPEDAMERMSRDELPAPCQVNRLCPVSVSNIIMKGLAVRQEDRYQSVETLAADMEAALQNPGDASIAAGENAVPQSSWQAAPVFGQEVPEAKEETVFLAEDQGQSPETEGHAGHEGGKTVGKKRKKSAGSGRKLGKKQLLLLCGGAAVLLVVVFLLAGRKPKVRENNGFMLEAGNLPSQLAGYEIVLNETSFALPVKLEEFTAAGWEFAKTEALDQKLAPHKKSETLELINGYGNISITLFNPTDNTLKYRDCLVGGVNISSLDLNDNYLDETVNSASTADGLTVGVSIRENFYGSYPGGYKRDESTTLIEYTYGPDAEHCYTIVVQNKEGGNVARLRVANYEDKEGLLANEYLSVKPDCYDSAFLDAAKINDLALEIGGNNYTVACFVQDFLDYGWTLEKGPEYIPSKGSDTVYLRKDTRTTMSVTAYNPSDYAVAPAYCLIYKLGTFGSDFGTDTPKDEFKIVGSGIYSGLNIEKDMEIKTVKELLDSLDLAYEDTGRELDVQLYGGEERMLIVHYVAGSSGNVVSSYDLEAGSAVINYFNPQQTQ